MSKAEKLIERFKNMPTDFTFDEMVKFLSIFGYEIENKGQPIRLYAITNQ